MNVHQFIFIISSLSLTVADVGPVCAVLLTRAYQPAVLAVHPTAQRSSPERETRTQQVHFQLNSIAT
jgi:hypothetical protein